MKCTGTPATSLPPTPARPPTAPSSRTRKPGTTRRATRHRSGPAPGGIPGSRPRQRRGLPENAVTGTIFVVNQGDLPVTVSAQEGKLRLWRNTSLTSLAAGTSQALAAHTIGYESDEDLDNGFRPAGLIHLSTTTGAVDQVLTDFGSAVAAGSTTHHLTLYRAASGALVFGAGSVQWTWGLDQEHDGNGAPADPRMQQAQVNLLADMGRSPPPSSPPSSRQPQAPTTPRRSSRDVSGVRLHHRQRRKGHCDRHRLRFRRTGRRRRGVHGRRDQLARSDRHHQLDLQLLPTGPGAQAVRVSAIDDSGNYPRPRPPCLSR